MSDRRCWMDAVAIRVACWVLSLPMISVLARQPMLLMRSRGGRALQGLAAHHDHLDQQVQAARQVEGRQLLISRSAVAQDCLRQRSC